MLFSPDFGHVERKRMAGLIGNITGVSTSLHVRIPQHIPSLAHTPLSIRTTSQPTDFPLNPRSSPISSSATMLSPSAHLPGLPCELCLKIHSNLHYHIPRLEIQVHSHIQALFKIEVRRAPCVVRRALADCWCTPGSMTRTLNPDCLNTCQLV
jgi:hypothetical protein